MLAIHDISYVPPVTPPEVPPLPPANCPLIIDNGASRFRAGFATSPDTPTVDEPNVYSKYRGRHGGSSVLLYGQATDLEASSRANTKPTWEGDVLVNPDGVEAGMDFTLARLLGNTTTATEVAHPVVMTERLASPLHSRAIVSELLFEAYHVPSVVYGIDGLFAFEDYQRRHRPTCEWTNESSAAAGVDGLVIDMGHCSTSLIPILNGHGVLDRAKR